MLKPETIQDKINFIRRYMAAQNAATGSDVDQNANVSDKNIATLAAELPKKDNIILQRAVMKEYITKLYGPELAAMYEKDIDSHIIYRHDETSGAGGFPYCCSITLYPFLLEGLKTIGGSSLPPKHGDSFIGGILNLIFAVAAQFVGAVACPELLTYMDHFLRLDYGQDYVNRLDEVIEKRGNKSRTLRERINDWFGQFTYTINQPAAARGNQSVFFNIAYFDSGYFHSIFKDFYFPDGDQPCWETTKELQKMYMKWFNAERLKNVLTFPVETANMLVDKETGQYKDEEMADFFSEMWAEGASFFMYQSDSADSLSSCCFDGSQKVLTRSSGGHVKLTTFKELLDGKYSEVARNLAVYHNGSWKLASRVKLPKRPLYKITTANKKTIIVTDNHINPTMRGDVVTTDLSTDDYLMFSTLPVDSIKEQDQHLTYEQGYLIGLFAGDGSISERKDCNSCDITFSLNHDKNDKSLPILKKALEQLNIDKEFHCYDSKNNVYFVKNFSRELEQFIHHWINTGHADSKAYNLNCLEQSIEFRRGILAGHYDSDGGNSNRIYSISKDLIDGLEAICTSLGIQTIIDVTDRTDEDVVIRGQHYKRNYPLYCIRWYDRHNKRSMGDSYKVINNSIFFRIISIEPYKSDDNFVYCVEVKDETEPYFTLPNGIITHNCRLRNGIESNVFSYTLGAGGIKTGSKAVITLNLNRIVQDWAREHSTDLSLSEYLTPIVERVHKYLTAFNEKLWDDYNNGILTIYKAGYIGLNDQYLTVGINGFLEGAEYLDIKADPDNEKYRHYAFEILNTIENLNKRDRTEKTRFNLEFVPSL